MCQWLALPILSSFFVLSSALSSGVTIDIDNGIVYEQRGYYSEEIREQIFHIFIPVNNLCLETSNSDLCLHTKSIGNDVIEINTILPAKTGMDSIYDRKSIGNITKKDLGRVLQNHDVESFASVTRSIIYYIDDHFYPISPLEDIAFETAPSLFAADEQTVHSGSISTFSSLLDETSKRKIGYDFLTSKQITELFSLLVPNSSRAMHLIADGDYKETLVDMTIGQSIFVMGCPSMHDQSSASLTSSCLIISTLFRNLPIESASLYSVYRAMSLPVSVEGQSYVYENVPQLFGYNPISERILIWREEEMKSSCLMSYIVQCPFHPISTDLSNFPCLAELLSAKASTIDHCQVSRTPVFEPVPFHVGNGLWYFHSPQEPFACHVNAPTSAAMKSVLIRPPMITKFPCDREIQCSNVKLPISHCKNQPIHVKRERNVTLSKGAHLSLSLTNITDQLLSLHDRASQNILIRIESQISSGKTVIEKHLDDFISGGMSMFSLFILSIGLVIVKYIKQKTIERLDKLQSEMNRLQRDCLLDV